MLFSRAFVTHKQYCIISLLLFVASESDPSLVCVLPKPRSLSPPPNLDRVCFKRTVSSFIPSPPRPPARLPAPALLLSIDDGVLTPGTIHHSWLFLACDNAVLAGRQVRVYVGEPIDVSPIIYKCRVREMPHALVLTLVTRVVALITFKSASGGCRLLESTSRVGGKKTNLSVLLCFVCLVV